MNQTTPQATKFEDRCSKCQQPCSRVRVRLRSGVLCYLTSCCNVAPLAVPVVKE